MKHLVTKAKNTVPPERELYIENSPFFQLDDLTAIHFGKAKTKDFYCLLNKKIHTRCQTGSTKLNHTMHLDGEAWKGIFNSLKKNCKEAKLKEFQFKLSHRIVVTKSCFVTELKPMTNASIAVNTIQLITHLVFANLLSTLQKNVIDWFNAINNSNFIPTIEEKLFGILSGPYNKTFLRKFNYTTLFIRYYIHTCKMQNKAIHLSTFIDKFLSKYRVEKLNN